MLTQDQSSTSPGFDATRLTRYMQAHVPGTGSALRLSRIDGGQSNPTFFVDTDGRRMVLRKRPAGDLLPSAHAVDREYRVQDALADTSVRVPRMIHFCDDPDVIGTQFYLMERLDGEVLTDNALADRPKADRGAYFDALADMLARIHAVDIDAVGLTGFGKSGGFGARQVRRWSKQLDLSGGGQTDDFTKLAAWLPDHLPEDDTTTLVHGDFRLGNVMFAEGRPDIVAVLDWELSTLGHPMADLAHSCVFTWFMDNGEYGQGLRDVDTDAAGLRSLDDFVARYFDAAGGEGSLSRFWLVLALFRNAVIFEGIAARARAGNASSTEAASVGRLAPKLAARGVQLIET